MNRVPVILLLACAAGSVHAQSPSAGFGWFGSLSGSCWSGQFPDGKTRHAQCYTTQFDKFIRGTASLSEDKGGQPELRFAGDSVFAWDDATQRIVYYIWGSDGSHRRLEAHFIGDELAFPVPSRADPSQTAYRSVWRRIDRDSFEVRRERPGAGGWSTELTVVYRRSPLQSPGAGK